MTVEAFLALYAADPFYSWFGLDHPLMYAEHRAGGGITSVYRQIGIGCEEVFRAVLMDRLGLSAADVRWAYSVPTATRARTLTLDGRIPLGALDTEARQRIGAWVGEAAAQVGIVPAIAGVLTGIVFEVRQGYKSKDAKRQNADVSNAANILASGHLPVLIVLSNQIDGDVARRYASAGWLILRGTLAGTPLDSTYLFCRDVIGHDLAAFFARTSAVLQGEVDGIL